MLRDEAAIQLGRHPTFHLCRLKHDFASELGSQGSQRIGEILRLDMKGLIGLRVGQQPRRGGGEADRTRDGDDVGEIVKDFPHEDPLSSHRFLML
ncbi:hypothetical protein [Sphingobium sp. D43FB]|uniref:hypothetical protein n=1 Tax=Sphingobium sp. D43FB TaxID=2017595 RepID=UPI0015968B8D|nr:hypothetical protein [Sphingobium sp. D43FB]